TIGALVIAGTLFRGGMGTSEAVTVSFLTLAFAQLWNVFNVRDVASPVLRNEITHNPYVWGALTLSGAILVAAVCVPVASLALGTAPIGFRGWTVVLGMSLVPLLGGQLEREYRRRFANRDAT
ncbi:MAG: cation transporting ATPase C-terminal domain-containing protein, partial [Halanaeroarchaeum sp.]